MCGTTVLPSNPTTKRSDGEMTWARLESGLDSEAGRVLNIWANLTRLLFLNRLRSLFDPGVSTVRYTLTWQGVQVTKVSTKIVVMLGRVPYLQRKPRKAGRCGP